MKKLAILQQGGHIDGDETEHQKEMLEGIGDFFRLNWAGDISDKHATICVYKKTKWTEGRQLLYEWVVENVGEYEYYLFIDDDVRFVDDKVKMLPSLLEMWNPLCAAFDCYVLDEDNKEWDQRKEPAKKLRDHRYFLHDENHNLFHRSVLKTLFPVPFHGPGAWLRYIECTVGRIYPEKMVRFSGIKVKNMKHRERGEGHGDHGGAAYHSMLRKFNQISYVPRLKRAKEKRLAANTNAALCRELPSGRCMEFTEDVVSLVFDIDSGLWKNRRWISQDFEESIA